MASLEPNSEKLEAYMEVNKWANLTPRETNRYQARDLIGSLYGLAKFEKEGTDPVIPKDPDILLYAVWKKFVILNPPRDGEKLKEIFDGSIFDKPENITREGVWREWVWCLFTTAMN